MEKSGRLNRQEFAALLKWMDELPLEDLLELRTYHEEKKQEELEYPESKVFRAEDNNLGSGLVITRRVNEYVVVDDGKLLIQIAQIRGKQVRLKFVGKSKIDRPGRAIPADQQSE